MVILCGKISLIAFVWPRDTGTSLALSREFLQRKTAAEKKKH